MIYTLIRSRRRKRSLALKVTDSGELVVRAPLYPPKLFIDHFVRSKHDWVTRQQSRVVPTTPPIKHFSSQAELENFIHKQIDHYQEILDLHPTSIKFKTVRSYWGNCHTSGRLTFNYALQYAPESAVKYVVVHELAHLKHRGHGKRFWNLVNKTYPHVVRDRTTLRNLRHHVS